MTGLMFALLGVMFAMAEINRRLGGISGYVEGRDLSARRTDSDFSPARRGGQRDDVSHFLRVAIAALIWRQDRPFALATCLVMPALFKGLTAAWCPFLFVPPVKWRTIAWMAVWTVALNGTVLFCAGLRPYQTWLHDILPNALDMGVEGN